jgi:hypothetical protein
VAVLERRADGAAHGLVAHAHHLLRASTAALLVLVAADGFEPPTFVSMSPTSCHCSMPRHSIAELSLNAIYNRQLVDYKV